MSDRILPRQRSTFVRNVALPFPVRDDRRPEGVLLALFAATEIGAEHE